MAEIQVTDASFAQDVLQSKQPVMVDFWASWCGPCKILGPIVKEVATEFEGKPVVIAKVNVDENPDIAGRYQILSIPTIMFFKDGKPVDQMVGVQPKDVLVSKLKSLAA